jgi:hypothetical protein
LKQVVRITGLVKLADHVRREIGRGLPARDRQSLRVAVHRVVDQVDTILRDRRARAANLATPSRRAYQFLKSVPWDTIPERQAEARPTSTKQEFRLPGLGALMDRLTRRLATTTDASELGEVARAIEQASRRTEHSIARQKLSPEQLTPASREQRGWFAWLAAPDNFRQYTTALALARDAFAPFCRDPRGSAPPRTFAIEFRPSRHIYKMRTRHNVSRIELPIPMVRFDAAGFADLAHLIFSHDRDAKRRVVERMKSESYVDAMTDIDALGGVVEGTRGAVFDLAAVFDRVNAAYFAGQLPRPRLTWSRTFTRRKFGHYDHVKDWVMVSSTLDQPHVPEFVVDFLMYHELLHKKHGIHWVNGRGLAHTRAFYADEARFPRLTEAEAFLKKLARA